MRYAHGLGALLVVFGSVSEVQAQFGVSGLGYTRSAWVGNYPGGLRVVGHSVSVTGFNGYPTGIGYPNAVGYPGGFGFYGPRPAYVISSVPIAYPALGVSTIGSSIGIGIASPTPIAAPQPIIIQQQAPPPQPIIIQQQAPPPQPIIIQQAAPAPNLVDPIVIRPRNQADNAPAMPGAPAGGFRPLKPEDRAGALAPAKPDDKKKPAEEKNQPLLLGKQAFADREYGRALRFFKQATDAQPKNALGFFLQAQAEFALGKYRDAVVSIHDGLRLEKDWPRSKFKPLEMYGPNAADFTDHMDQLQAALKRNPGDAVLLFLYAYELWFDGREDEARVLFLKARKLVAEPRFIDLFLAGKAADPVAAR